MRNVIFILPVVMLASCRTETETSYSTATAKVNFDGNEYALSHPVASIGVWPHQPGIRTARIDIFQTPARGKYVEQIKNSGVPMFMGSDLKVPHLTLNLHVKEDNLELNKDAIEFVGVTIQALPIPGSMKT